MTNIKTVLDQDFRNDAYKLVARAAASPILQMVGLSAIKQAVIERNPLALEKKAVERATVRIAESSAILLRDVAVLKGETVRLAAERKAFQTQLRVSEAALASHKVRVVKLSASVMRRAGQSVRRHFVSLSGHALPILSATIAVAGFGLDVNDACDSLKELDEINQSVGLPLSKRSTVCGVTVPTAGELLAEARRDWRSVYGKSAEALNSGAQMLPSSPPIMSRDAAREWVAGIFRK